eukprot:scaffold3060_cov121-Isochrysis_galbana.AAC.3
MACTWCAVRASALRSCALVMCRRAACRRCHDGVSPQAAATHEGLGGVGRHALVREDPCVERELDGILVDDPDGADAAGGLDDCEERVLVPRRRVELDDLLGLVGPLRQLDLGLHVALARLEQHLHALHLLPKRVRDDAAALHALGRLARKRGVGLVHAGLDDGGVKREVERCLVVHRDRLGVLRGLDDSGDGSGLAVL